MSNLISSIENIRKRFPETLDFVKWLPFGLMADLKTDKSVSINTHLSWALISFDPSISGLCLVPPLIRLALAVLENIPMPNVPSTRLSELEEMAWLYSYARAQTISGGLSQNLMPLETLKRCTETVSILHEKIKTNQIITSTDRIQATLAAKYNIKNSRQLASLRTQKLDAAWKTAKTCSSFVDFINKSEHAYLLNQPSAREVFFTRKSPKSRHVLHHCYGKRSSTVLASTRQPWLNTDSIIHKLKEYTIKNPLVHENHDLNMPVGLLAAQHLHRASDGALELHADVFVFSESHWKKFGNLGGFSVGIQGR